MWSRKTLVMKASGSVRTWEFSALWSRVCTEKHPKLWFHLWNSHSRQAQTLLTWQRFTPGGLLTEEALSAHNLKSAGHIWNAVLLCSFSTLVKNIQAIKKKEKKKEKDRLWDFFFLFFSQFVVSCSCKMSSVLKLCACSSLFFTTDDHYKDSANVQAARPGKTVGAKGKSVECNGCDSESNPSV